MNFKQLRELFIFSSRERNGILVLIFILGLIAGTEWLISRFSLDKEVIPEAAKVIMAKPDTLVKAKPVNAVAFHETFDPNEAGRETLAKLAIPTGLMNNWLKYLEKGGRFRRREDVRKLYGMTDELYNRIAGSMSVKPGNTNQKSFVDVARPASLKEMKLPVGKPRNAERYAERAATFPLELNGADSVQLEARPGIGPVLASRILRYRKLLGGFCSAEQLREIYGLSEELWNRAKPGLWADSAGIRKIELNYFSVTELGRHPYIGFRQAKKIVNYRSRNGKFVDADALNSLFSPDSMRRLRPYLSVAAGEP